MPGAVRSWGDAHARYGRLSRDAILAPAIELARDGFPAWDGFIEAVERTARPMVAEVARRRTPGSSRSIGRTGGRGARASGSGCRPWPRRSRRSRGTGSMRSTTGTSAERQARGLGGGRVARSLAADLAAHTSTWGEPIAIDYRGVRVTTHPPNSSGLVALELLAILARFEAPPAASFGPDGVTDPAWIHLGIEAAKLAMADRDAHLTDPAFRDVPVERLLDPAYARTLAARIDPRRAARPPAVDQPARAAGRSTSPPSMRRATRSA